MKCRACGADMPEHYSFCTKCGTEMNPEDDTEKGLSPGIIILIVVLLISIVITLLLAMGIIGTSRAARATETVTATQDVNTGDLPVNTPSLEPPEDVATEPEEPTSDTYLLPDSSTRYLTVNDISSLSWQQLCLARNEIFARHGLFFDVPELDAYFQSQSWYTVKVSINDYGFDDLSDEEIANAALIADYEKAQYGGSFY